MIHQITRTGRGLVQTTRSFVAYLRCPALDRAQGPLPRPWIVWLGLFALSVIITSLFALLTLPTAIPNEVAPGSPLQQTLSQSILPVIVSIVITGPLIEEIMFRGWLSGAWNAIVACLLFLAIFYGSAPFLASLMSLPLYLAQLVAAGLGIGAMQLLSPLDAGRRLPYFEKAFPYIFWAQGIVFGVLHTRNVASEVSIGALIHTLPLILCAWLWGYARIVLNLRSAVLLHSAFNFLAIAGMVMVRLSG